MAVATAAAVVGMGLAAVGAYNSISGASDASDAQKQMIAVQQQQEAERKKAMEMDARRRTVEVVRNQQRARALAFTSATAQGANLGSGLQGGYGQISGQTGDNLLGIFGQREIGRNMFGLSQQMGQAQSNYADAQSTMAFGSGLSSLGGAVLGNLGTINAVGQGFGGISTGVSNYANYGSWAGSGFNGSGAPRFNG